MKKNKTTKNPISNEIAINDILVTYNPRKYFNEKTLIELCESIKSIGVIQPVTVRPLKDTPDKYELICGERRLRASKMAGKETIPAYIRECTEDERLEIAFVENLQREDVREIEIAEAIKALFDTGKEDFNSIAVRLGKSVKYVRDRCKLNDLTDNLKELVNNESLSIGKAVLLASYSHEIQDAVFEEHLSDENGYYYWGALTLKQFENRIDTNYNCNLKLANFDLTECQTCKFNSKLTDLFSSDENNGRCLNKNCFVDKLRNFAINEALNLINQNPEYLIVNYHCSGWFIDALKANGIEIAEVKYKQLPQKPAAPTEPVEADFLDENGELDDGWFDDAKNDYETELQDYQQDLKAYEEDIKTIEQAEQDRKIEFCYVIWFDKLITAYREIIFDDTFQNNSDDDENGDDAEHLQDKVLNLQSVKKAQLAKLQEKDLRNREIKIEHIITDLKNSVIVSDKDLSNKKGVKLENHILFYYLLSKASVMNREKWFGKSYPTDKEKYEFVLKLTEEQRTAIIRDYIINKLRSFAFNAHSIDTQLMMEFAKLHFEEETVKITLHHQDIYDKRKASIDAKIADIQKQAKPINVAAFESEESEEEN